MKTHQIMMHGMRGNLQSTPLPPSSKQEKDECKLREVYQECQEELETEERKKSIYLQDMYHLFTKMVSSKGLLPIKNDVCNLYKEFMQQVYQAKTEEQVEICGLDHKLEDRLCHKPCVLHNPSALWKGVKQVLDHAEEMMQFRNKIMDGDYRGSLCKQVVDTTRSAPINRPLTGNDLFPSLGVTVKKGVPGTQDAVTDPWIKEVCLA